MQANDVVTLAASPMLTTFAPTEALQDRAVIPNLSLRTVCLSASVLIPAAGGSIAASVAAADCDQIIGFLAYSHHKMVSAK